MNFFDIFSVQTLRDISRYKCNHTKMPQNNYLHLKATSKNYANQMQNNF